MTLFEKAALGFKQACVVVTEFLVHGETKTSEAEWAANIETVTQKVRTESFTLKQQAAWSDTPERDRKAVDFIVLHILPIADKVDHIKAMKAGTKKGDSGIDLALIKPFSEILALEQSNHCSNGPPTRS